METVRIHVTVSKFEEEYKTRIAGVTHCNPDGSDRQTLIRKCRPGEPVELRREADNPYDKFAILVISQRAEVLGYIPAGDRQLAGHIDRGGQASAYVIAVTGGPNIFQRLLRLGGKHYGCVIRIVKKDCDWKVVTPWMDANTEIDRLLKAGRRLEKDAPDKAVALYRDAIARIKKLDAEGAIASAWRTARYPIDRLSLVLLRQGKNDDAAYEIALWRDYPDRVGLSDAEHIAVDKREARLLLKRT